MLQGASGTTTIEIDPVLQRIGLLMGKTVAFVLKDRKVIKEMTVNRVKVNQAKMVRMDMHHKFQKMDNWMVWDAEAQKACRNKY